MDILSPPVQTTIVFLGRLCLGLYLLHSAMGKLTHRREFIQATVDYRVLPEQAARVFGTMLPWIELVLAVALIMGVGLPVAATASALLLICFMLAITTNLRRERRIPCNCYGMASTSSISWGTNLRNLLLLLNAATIAVLSPWTLGYAAWLDRWGAELALLSSPGKILIFALTLSFCFVAIQLAEWTVDISGRVAQLTHP